MMRIRLFVILFSTCFSLRSQDTNELERGEVLKVFESFFRAMNQRDTLTLKAITFADISNQFFISTTAGNDQRLQGTSGITFKGFIDAVGQEGSPTGLCQNEFDNFSLSVYDRYAVVSAEYTCIINEQKRIHGFYTLQFRKTNKWKVFYVNRYIKSANEYFPESDLKNDRFHCPGINVSFNIPDGWEEMDKIELFTLGYGPYKNVVLSDTIVVKYRLIMAIKKVDESERLLTYVTEPKYSDEGSKELVNTLRQDEVKKYQAKVDKGLIRLIRHYNYSIESQKINGKEFLIVDQQKTFRNDNIVDNISFDAIIGNYILSIEGFTDDPVSKNELISIVGQYEF